MSRLTLDMTKGARDDRRGGRGDDKRIILIQVSVLPKQLPD